MRRWLEEAIMWPGRIATAMLVVFVLLGVSACGTADTMETTTTVTVPASTTTTTTADTGDDGTSTTTTSTTLPGQPILGPTPRTTWAVVGVQFDDVLNVRVLPGATAEVVERLDPTFDAVVVDGEARIVDRTIWWSVNAAGVLGWVSSNYLATIGETDDVTAAVVASNGDERPAEMTMEQLAIEVARLRGADEIVVVIAPDEGDTSGEVTIDAFQRGDDSVRGERLLVVGQRDDAGAAFGLHVVEATTLCWRGVDANGLCV